MNLVQQEDVNAYPLLKDGNNETLLSVQESEQ